MIPSERARIIELGKRGMKLREISEDTGFSIPWISTILRREHIKSYFYVKYEIDEGRPYEGHHGRPYKSYKSDGPEGYVTASEAGRILGLDRRTIGFLCDDEGHRRLENQKIGNYRWVSLDSIHAYADSIFKDAARSGQKIRNV